jgi:hypothetical protein
VPSPFSCKRDKQCLIDALGGEMVLFGKKYSISRVGYTLLDTDIRAGELITLEGIEIL